MANPLLNERTFAPTAVAGTGHVGSATFEVTTGRTMSYGGTASAAGLMLVGLVIGAVLGWGRVVETTVVDATGARFTSTAFNGPGWVIAAAIVAFVIAIGTAFRPLMARFTWLPYSLAEGYVLGAISHLYDSQTRGVAVQAVIATCAVFLAMLALYGLRILRATPRFTKGVIAATFGVGALYLVGFIVSLFNRSALTFFNSPSPLSIGFSLVIVVIASLNLIIDFDVIERGVKSGAPAAYEWFGAFGLILTLVWLYLEMLRLLSKLQRR